MPIPLKEDKKSHWTEKWTLFTIATALAITFYAQGHKTATAMLAFAMGYLLKKARVMHIEKYWESPYGKI